MDLQGQLWKLLVNAHFGQSAGENGWSISWPNGALSTTSKKKSKRWVLLGHLNSLNANGSNTFAMSATTCHQGCRSWIGKWSHNGAADVWWEEEDSQKLVLLHQVSRSSECYDVDLPCLNVAWSLASHKTWVFCCISFWRVEALVNSWPKSFNSIFAIVTL